MTIIILVTEKHIILAQKFPSEFETFWDNLSSFVTKEIVAKI